MCEIIRAPPNNAKISDFFWKSAGLVFATLPPGNNVDDICDGDHPTLFPGGRGAENKTGRFQKLLVSVHAMAENRTGRFR